MSRVTRNSLGSHIVTAVLVSFLGCLISASARAVGLIDWTNRADVICVASYDSMKPLGSKPIPPGYMESLVTDAVTMNVTAVWKGTLPEHKIVLNVTHVERNNGQYFPFKPFSRSSSYLIFVRRQAGSAIYDPMDAPSFDEGFGSDIPLSSLSSEITPQMPVFTKVVLQDIAGLSENDPLVRGRALGLLDDFDWLYIHQVSYRPALPPGTAVADLRKMITTRALPEVLRLTKDKDEETRFHALETAAHLQQTQVIPAIAEMSESQSLYAPNIAVELMYYRNDEAVPLLIPQMLNKNPDARMFTIEAFEGLKDRRTIPFLIDALGDSDKLVHDRALYCLYLITKLPTTYEVRGTPENAADALHFWQEWKTDHSQEIDQLRKKAFTTN